MTLIGKINVFSYFAEQGRKSLSCTPKWLERVKIFFGSFGQMMVLGGGYRLMSYEIDAFKKEENPNSKGVIVRKM